MMRYGSLQRFKDAFSPASMRIVAEDPERAYYGTAPTLADVRLAYGGDADAVWLCMLMDDFIEYCGKGCLSGSQIMRVVQRLSMKSHLKVTEFMLFFWRLGNAEYGRIFGSIDPLFITDSFNKFLKQRDRERSEYAVSTTDDVELSSDWPVIRPKEFYQIAKSGGCINPEAGEIALETLGPY